MTPAARVQRQVRRERWKGILIAGAATALAIFVAVGIATSVSNEKSSQARHTLEVKLLVGACQRGNVVRAYLAAAARDNKDHPTEREARARAVFPILNCRATVAQGEPVALGSQAQTAFIARAIPSLK